MEEGIEPRVVGCVLEDLDVFVREIRIVCREINRSFRDHPNRGLPDAPADEDEFCRHEVNLEITSRGALHITMQLWCSMGSYGTTTNSYTYRYQNGDFYLIGTDSEEMSRNTGETTVVSENYLTWKRQVTQSNAFNEEPATEKWSRLKKKPLEKLGAREL